MSFHAQIRRTRGVLENGRADVANVVECGTCNKGRHMRRRQNGGIDDDGAKVPW